MLALLLACVARAPAPTDAPSPEPPPFAVEVDVREGTWTLRYRFAEPQAALLFDTSHGDWRAQTWLAEPGVRLESHGGLDLMVLDPPATEARFTLAPAPLDPPGTPPWLAFSDGSAALYTGQLAVLTVESREAAVALEGDLSRWRGEQPEVQVTVTADQPLFGPEGGAERLRVTAFGGTGPYVYAGPLAEGDVVLDPGLPAPAREAFAQDFPEVVDALARRWDQEIPSPTALLAWGGEAEALLNQGHANGRQVAMQIRGAVYAEGDPQAIADLIWFFAHEIHHQHQFAGGRGGSTWMVEGFANTLATATLVELGLSDTAALERHYYSVARECARELSRGPLDGARGRANYVCGDLVGLVLEAQAPGGIPAVWKQAQRLDPLGRPGRAELTVALFDAGVTPEVIGAIEAFVTQAHPDPDAAIAALLTAGGLEPVFVEGGLQTMAFPF